MHLKTLIVAFLLINASTNLACKPYADTDPPTPSTATSEPKTTPVTDNPLCPGDGWTAYGDEKCIKLITEFKSYSEAESVCNSQQSKLLTIKTLDEQLALGKWLPNELEVNIWIGLKRSESDPNQFLWNDNTLLDNSSYTNWAPGRPRDNPKTACVELQSDLARFARSADSLWSDVSCNLMNWLICEKPPSWDDDYIKRLVINLRRNQQQAKSSLDDALVQLGNVKDQLDNVSGSAIPLGYIYVQLPDQPEPSVLWPKILFEDISANYSGLFFRVVGGQAADFGQTQLASTRVLTVNSKSLEAASKNTTVTVLPATSDQIFLFTGDRYNNNAEHRHIEFTLTDDEVRPENKAIKIWKRV
ncbi:uncharacterized protein LOC128952493 [Oppia nitens]|uniref:uncharacterized protein LOC128952493 n=1 Tax=Oppia nitens TaxID=1686743 RepID=UPI0023DA3ED8|nr:uncharacterized protein LOC128952493 [Oppia nitens]